MHALNVLVFDRHPGQLLTLHQALNACGVYQVQVADTIPLARRALRGKRPLDISLLDSRHDAGLLDEPALQRSGCALLLRGDGPAAALELRAREKGLWVLGHVPWEVPVHRLHLMLQHYRQLARPGHAA